MLDEAARLYPPAAVTLPWDVPDGKPVTFTLLVTRPDGSAMHRTNFNQCQWQPAREKAGIVPAPPEGIRRTSAREAGMHVLRHTAASTWLAAGVGIPAVAAWLGDTEQTVLATYAHMVPEDDDRGRKAMDRFFARDTGSALHVQAEGQS